MSVTGGNHAVVVGLDVGGTKTNATVLDETGAFLIDRMMETPSRVHQGPAAAIEVIGQAMDRALEITGRSRDDVLAVGLDTPGRRAHAVSSRLEAPPTLPSPCGGVSTFAAPSSTRCTSR